MGPTARRAWWGTMVSCLAWAALAGTVAYPLYVWVANAYQALVMRLAAAVILGIAIRQIHIRMRGDLDAEPQSRFDLARKPRARVVVIDPRLQKLYGEVLRSAKSRRHFDTVLWPRLLALAQRLGVTLQSVPVRWPAPRGTALSTIAKLLSSLERRP